MTWQPKPPIAAVLGLLTTPLGMLYVQRPRLAAGYFGASILASTVAFFSMWAFGSQIIALLFLIAGWGVSIACAVHAYRIAKDGPAIIERKWYSRWQGLTSVFVVGFLAVFLTRSFLYEPFRIRSVSMHPTLPKDSIVIVDKSGFGHYGTFGITLWNGAITEQIQRGDIIVHELVADPSTRYVTRIVALPGDHIRYANRQMTINGEPVPVTMRHRVERYQYASERLDERDIELAYMPERVSKDFDEVVPPGHYVVFGDSRDNARDSRYIGAIPQSNIVGRVATILRPREAGRDGAT
jgi:signal peptidase I